MDNPRKKKADGKRVSQQPHEQAYQKRKAAKASNSGESKNDSKSSGGRGNDRKSGRSPES